MFRLQKWLIVPAVMIGALACGSTRTAQAQWGISVGVPGAYGYYGAPYPAYGYRPYPAYGYPAYGYGGYGYPAYYGGGVSLGIGPAFGYRPYGFGGYYGGYHHHGRW
jgi:hypothetical protein